MPGMLTRSKSLRFLKSSRKDVAEVDNANSMPPLKGAQTDSGKYQSTTQNSKVGKDLEASDMPVRPTTSGGSSERTIMFHKKTNPAPSFISQDHIQSFQSPTTSTTVLCPTDATKEQGVIGIALGSPTSASHWSPPSQTTDLKTDSQRLDSPMTSLNPSHGISPSLSSRQETPKPKLSRWKSLFRKAAPPPQPEKFYKLVQTATAATPASRADSHHDEEVGSQEPPVRAKQEKETLHAMSPPTFKPDIRASRKWAPGEFVAPQSPPERSLKRERALTLGNSTSSHRRNESIQRSFTTPAAVSRSISDESSPMPHVPVSENNNTPIRDPNASLLDISIPDITMERYSVMFGKVLQCDPSQKSLLARRQGNSEKIKPLNDLSSKDESKDARVDHRLERRATSPTTASSSPRLSLFPAPNPTRAPSPLSGSVMNRSKKDLKRTRTTPAKSSSESTEEKTQKPDSTKLKPAVSPYLKPALTPTSICSFESEADSITIVVAHATPGHTKPLKLHLDEREPEWEILSKLPKTSRTAPSSPTSAASAPSLVRAPSQKQPKVTKLSALSSHPSSAPLDVSSPLQRLQSLSTPPHSASRLGETREKTRREGKAEEVPVAKAMVGVARSVSVSRANSPRHVVRTLTDAKSPKDERFVDRHALTPTMVEVKNRRSQRVQLEDA